MVQLVRCSFLQILLEVHSQLLDASKELSTPLDRTAIMAELKG